MKPTILEFAKTVAPNTVVILTTRTQTKMNKKDVATKTIANTLPDTFKRSQIKVILNANYQDRVNESRIKEGKPADFVAAELPYGQMAGNALIEKNGQFYLKCIELERIGNPTYEDEDGVELLYEDMKPFIPYVKPSPKQDLDHDVKVLNFKIENVLDYEVVEE